MGVRREPHKPAQEVASGRLAFIHPLPEKRDLLLWPRLVARHAPIFHSGVNLLGLLFDLLVGGEIEPKPLHRFHVAVAKKRPDVVSEA